MKKDLPSYLIAIIWAVALCACENNAKSSINPNGDSELALLMREMHEDGLRTKQQILDGEEPNIKVKYHQLHTANATEPEKAASAAYKSFAAYYEATVKSLLESNDSNKAASYQNMVDACMRCHQELCPGPMVKIKRLYLSEKEMASLNPIQQ
jgi:hypothetical protein